MTTQLLTVPKVVSMLIGLAIVVGGAWMANKWGDGVVSTAAGLALIGIGTGLCTFTGLVSTPPKFTVPPEEK